MGFHGSTMEYYSNDISRGFRDEEKEKSLSPFRTHEEYLALMENILENNKNLFSLINIFF